MPFTSNLINILFGTLFVLGVLIIALIIFYALRRFLRGTKSHIQHEREIRESISRKKKAPRTIPPGGKSPVEGVYVATYKRKRGNKTVEEEELQPWVACYDQQGRILARTDYTLGNSKAGALPIHYHLFNEKQEELDAEGRRAHAHFEGEYTQQWPPLKVEPGTREITGKRLNLALAQNLANLSIDFSQEEEKLSSILRGMYLDTSASIKSKSLIEKYVEYFVPAQLELEKKLMGQHPELVEVWKAHYDEQGRILARTDETSESRSDGIPPLHHHLFDLEGRMHEGHIIGAYIPPASPAQVSLPFPSTQQTEISALTSDSQAPGTFPSRASSTPVVQSQHLPKWLQNPLSRRLALVGLAAVIGGGVGEALYRHFSPGQSPIKGPPDTPAKCQEGTILCNNLCISTNIDQNNCGRCGNACSSGMICSSGICVCSSGTDCNGTCINTSSDNSNCGSCGNTCSSGMICSNGTCVCSSTTPCNGVCVDTTSDPGNCGTCGNACPSGKICSGGTCVCSSGTPCNEACIDTSSDNNNCGNCGNACSSGMVCSSGTCVCPPGQTSCGGGCIPSGTPCCGSGTTPCGGGCMPSGNTCCNTYSCPSGAACCNGGCIPSGVPCCAPGMVPCGTECMPSGATCCNNGTYCSPGYTCCGSICIPSGYTCCDTYGCPFGLSCCSVGPIGCCI